jgi:hypothetical protein
MCGAGDRTDGGRMGRMAGGDLLWVRGRQSGRVVRVELDRRRMAGLSLGDEGGGWREAMGCGRVGLR